MVAHALLAYKESQIFYEKVFCITIFVEIVQKVVDDDILNCSVILIAQAFDTEFLLLLHNQ